MSQPTRAAVATSSGARRMVSRALRRRLARHSAQLQGEGVYGMVKVSPGIARPVAEASVTRQGELG